jgi:amino-acid N-acetyltransferase
MKGIDFSFARPADEAAVKSLLAECGLPFEDISEHLIHFIVAKSGSRLVGVVGLEGLGGVGLLRSVAVKEPYRGKGLGGTLCEKMEGYVASQGIKRLYLLTRNAEGFFSKLGYRRVERAEAPEVVRNTKEFSMFCPETAACMVKDLEKILAVGAPL